ncbi:MAG: class I SAM-dependent methyltransferase [Candidatus Rokubacteria bacterium]|nr:class I SAM-dependent methyltransferase [Candidatus Rokubacteria bacterium]
MKWTEKRHDAVLETGVCRHLHAVRVRHLLDEIAAFADGANGLRVLDVGCGDGVITRRIHEALPAAHVEAVDADDVRLRRALAVCPGVRFHHADVSALPFREDAFDVVVCHHVIEHVGDDRRLLAEIHRVLAKDGLLLLGLPQEGGVVGRILRTLHRKLYAEGEHVNFYTIRTMRAMLAAQGFGDLRCAKFGFLFPHYYVHIALLSNPVTFRLGHLVSQRADWAADSLIFSARKRA